MSMLVNKDELIEIPVKYAELQLKNGRTIYLVSDDEFEKYKSKIKEHKIINTLWQEPTWKEYNAMALEATIMNEITGDKQTSLFKMRDLMLERNLKGWDVKDD